MALPTIEPIRPVLSKKTPIGSEWVYEAKLDGFRGTLYIDRGRGHFLSKNKKPLKRFEQLANAIAAALPVKSAIFDGEVIVMGELGPQFNALMFGRGHPEYAAFDLLWLDGADLRSLPLWRRKKRLQTLVRNRPIGYVESLGDPRLFDVAVAMDLEGIVAKRRTDPYAEGTAWVKVKHAGYSQQQRRWELFQKRR